MTVVDTASAIGIVVQERVMRWTTVVAHLDHAHNRGLVTTLVLVCERVHEMAEGPGVASIAAGQRASVAAVVLLLLLQEHVLTEVGRAGIVAVGAIA